MNNRPTPETDAELDGINAVCKEDRKLDAMTSYARKLERERDEAREEIRDWKRLHDAAERGVDLTIAEGTISDLLKQRDEARRELKFLWRERDEARELVYAWESRWKAEVEFAAKVSVKRDELREVLKKCREDSICYAEHMIKCGYSEAYKESKENADRAKRILEETK